MNGTYLTVAGRIRDELEETYRTARDELASFGDFLEEQGR